MTGSLTFIGTATTLLEHGGFTVLTDPDFRRRGRRAYLGKGVFSTRLTEPAMQPEDLPPVDVVVLSHLHADHFDRTARDRLPKDVPIVTTRAAARTLRRWGFANAVALETWGTHELRSAAGDVLRITAAPGQHAKGPLRPVLPPVHGHVLEFGTEPLSVYLTGDTLVVEQLEELPQRYPSLDVGVWHLGGTRIPGVLGLGAMVTMDGRAGADLWEIVRPRTTVPVHHDDYGVFRSPLSDFLAEVERRGISGVHPLRRGEALPL